MKRTQRVPKGETFYYISSNLDIIEAVDEGFTVTGMQFETGNYFTDRESAEAMVKKFRAVLKGAEVIEMPSEEEIVQEAGKGIGDLRYDGFLCGVNYVKSKIVK